MELKTAEEIWDENSETIGDTISDADYWCGRTVMEQLKFRAALREYAAQAVRMALEEAASFNNMSPMTKIDIINLESELIAKLK